MGKFITLIIDHQNGYNLLITSPGFYNFLSAYSVEPSFVDNIYSVIVVRYGKDSLTGVLFREIGGMSRKLLSFIMVVPFLMRVFDKIKV